MFDSSKLLSKFAKEHVTNTVKDTENKLKQLSKEIIDTQKLLHAKQMEFKRLCEEGNNQLNSIQTALGVDVSQTSTVITSIKKGATDDNDEQNPSD